MLRFLGQRAATSFRTAELALKVAVRFKTTLALLLEHPLHGLIADSALELKDVAGRKGTRIGKGALNRSMGKTKLCRGCWMVRLRRVAKLSHSLPVGRFRL